MQIFKTSIALASVVGLRVVFPPVDKPIEIRREELINTIYRIAQEEKVSPALVCAVAMHESRLDPNASNLEQKLYKNVFKKGSERERKENSTAYGLMQIVYGYHKDSCKLTRPSDLYNVEKNIRCGAQYLKKCVERNAKEKNNDRRLQLVSECYNGDGKKYSKDIKTALVACAMKN